MLCELVADDDVLTVARRAELHGVAGHRAAVAIGRAARVVVGADAQTVFDQLGARTEELPEERCEIGDVGGNRAVRPVRGHVPRGVNGRKRSTLQRIAVSEVGRHVEPSLERRAPQPVRLEHKLLQEVTE